MVAVDREGRDKTEKLWHPLSERIGPRSRRGGLAPRIDENHMAHHRRLGLWTGQRRRSGDGEAGPLWRRDPGDLHEAQEGGRESPSTNNEDSRDAQQESRPFPPFSSPF